MRRVGALAELRDRRDVLGQPRRCAVFRQLGEPLELPERKFHYVLVVLARQRLKDALAGHPDRECGWLDREALYQMLRTDRESLNTDVSRARKQLAVLGVAGARDLIEVWGDARRIGVARLQVDGV